MHRTYYHIDIDGARRRRIAQRRMAYRIAHYAAGIAIIAACAAWAINDICGGAIYC